MEVVVDIRADKVGEREAQTVAGTSSTPALLKVNDAKNVSFSSVMTTGRVGRDCLDRLLAHWD